MRLSTVFVVHSALRMNISLAHMDLQQPLPMRSPLDPLVPPEDIDYDLKNPLKADGSNYPCRGYQNDRPIRTTANYVAGQQYHMIAEGSATHGGGSCQISLSYDNGATFKVIKSIVGHCPLAPSYEFAIPSFAPAGDAIFAWTWFNEIGNREMYMSCAWVHIALPAKTKRSSRLSRFLARDQFTTMDSLPNIWRANIAGLNNCSTTEGQDPMFANLGPLPEFNGSMSATSAVTLPDANCDAPAPVGQLFKSIAVGTSSSTATKASASPSDDRGIEGVPADLLQATKDTAKAIVKTVNPENSTDEVNTMSNSTVSELATASSGQPSTSARDAAAPASSLSATSVTRNTTATPIAAFSQLGNGTAVSGLNSTNSTNSLDASNPANATSLLNGTSSIGSSNDTKIASASSLNTTDSTSALNTSSTTNSSSKDNVDNSIPAQPGAGPSITTPKTLSFAGIKANDYLPCVPGAFLCTSSTSFLICDQAPGDFSMTPLSMFKGPIQVAAGMECLPFLQSFPDQTTASKFANGTNVKNGLVPAGMFRSDRYAGAGEIAEVAESV